MTSKDFFNDIYVKYSDKVEELVTQPIPPIEVRFQIIEDLATEYLEETGGRLPHMLLSKLADWCLAETLTDKTTHKVMYEDYPILSDHQQKRRMRKELRTGDCMIDLFRNSHDKKQTIKLTDKKVVKKNAF